MPTIEAHVSIGEFDLRIAASRRPSPRRVTDSSVGIAPCRTPRSSESRLFAPWRLRSDGAPVVADFAVRPSARLVSAVASAAMVRDVAALGALILFGTMLALLLSSGDFII